ncbi:MAG TPA: hypothetical protein ENH84_00010 [Phycisphaerae bacterium]|nr:hypothetical protein [Phycisphaerae bacterium]
MNETENQIKTAEQPAHRWETEMDTYPLRTAKEDPRWAIATVGIWVCFAMFCIIFIVLLLVLGWYYD